MSAIPAIHVLHEDNHCLVVAKPAGLLTMGDATGDVTLLDQAKDYLRRAYHKPGEVFLGVVHRLDRPVSGVVLFARTSKAAARLSAQFREHRVEKRYLALVTGQVQPPEGTLVQRLLKDAATNTVRVVSAKTMGGQDCELGYRLIRRQGETSLLEIAPRTGRGHQIRVQLAHQGWPIVGDRKYGSPVPFHTGQIALHAHALTFEHPTQRVPITVTTPPPSTWPRTV
jgi:23S rRNA pseudouridine1911/1915/1917 synthase